MYIVLGLFAAGVVLLGAAWVTGASVGRIEELAFGGTGGLTVWLQNTLDRVLAFLDNALATVKGLL
jgi:hypothetical protein